MTPFAVTEPEHLGPVPALPLDAITSLRLRTDRRWHWVLSITATLLILSTEVFATPHAAPAITAPPQMVHPEIPEV